MLQGRFTPIELIVNSHRTVHLRCSWECVRCTFPRENFTQLVNKIQIVCVLCWRRGQTFWRANIGRGKQSCNYSIGHSRQDLLDAAARPSRNLGISFVCGELPPTPLPHSAFLVPTDDNQPSFPPIHHPRTTHSCPSLHIATSCCVTSPDRDSINACYGGW